MFGIDDALMVAGGASIVSGLLGADASKSAANTQASAADRATQVQQQNYQQTRTDLSPFRTAGASALQRLAFLSGTGGGNTTGLTQQHVDDAYQRYFGRAPTDQESTWQLANTRSAQDLENGIQSSPEYQKRLAAGASPVSPQSFADTSSAAASDFGSLTKPFDYSLADFYKDPSYAFQQSEGEKALTRGSASRGLAQSTPGLKALMQWNQDYANTSYSGAFNRAFGVDQSNKQTTYNFLSGMAGLGENAGAQTGNIGASTSSGIASSTMAGGAAIAGGITGSASAINNSIQGGLGNYMYNQRYQQTMDLYGNLMSGNSADPNFALDAGASMRRSG